MKIPFTNLEVIISRIGTPETTEERFCRLSNEITDCWKQSHIERLNLIPWINWENKQVFVAERSAIKRKC